MIAGILVETSVLSVLDLSRTVYNNLPETHDPLWEDLNTASDELFAALTAGLSAGITYHLAIDATVDGGGTYKDLPGSLPQAGQQTILVANAATEEIDAGERTLQKVAYETEAKIFKTFREAADFARQDTAWIVVRASDAPGFRVFRKVVKHTPNQR